MAGGNYGGNSIPTQAIDGYELVNTTTYDNYNCTSIVTSGGAGTFVYQGLTLGVAAGATMELIVNPAGVSASDKLIFLCYECSCDGPMSGITGGGDPAEYYSGTSAQFRPTIIGGGGLNS